MEKIIYTENTKEIRFFLEENYFEGLSFFKKGKFIHAYMSIRANVKKQWEERIYLTFNRDDRPLNLFMYDEYLNNEEFKKSILKLINTI